MMNEHVTNNIPLNALCLTYLSRRKILNISMLNTQHEMTAVIITKVGLF